MLNEVSAGKIIGIEDLGVTEDVIATSKDEESQDVAFDGIASNMFQQALVNAIKTLPEREALVLSLYYDEELNLREIGEVLDVSESRVSQIHSQAMVRLKSRLRDWS
jgi:RNA polymerase sigma factor for flagellar operon FliA